MSYSTPITLTTNATSHLKKLLSKDENQQKKIRLSIKAAGCSGLKYIIDLVDNIESTDIVYQADNELTVYIDKKAIPFIEGTIVDYVKQGINARFEYTNPQQKGACGCGESFYVDKTL